MGSYNSTNLIKYEDTIRLHFDQTGRIAWLTLMNYGVVFGEKPLDAAMVVTVGASATESGALPPGRATIDLKVLFKDAEFKPHPETISISAMLDAINVIKLQVEILNISSKKGITPVFVRRAIYDLIVDGLTTLDERPYRFRYWEDDKNFFRNTKDQLEKMLNTPPGAPTIRQAIEKYRPDNVGFTAYFPEPSLILQEERTRKKILVDPPLGKTWNTDTRDIQPILFDTREPSWGEKPGQDRVKDEREFKGEFAQILKKIDTKIQVGTGKADEVPGTLHIQIERINCFGFRGDSRNPLALKEGHGLLAGVTRTDAGVSQYKDRALAIDTTPLTAEELKCLEPLLDLDIMHLGKFTAEMDFKGYVSATKSTAMAKCFANHYEKVKTDLTTYCYAVRCRGGFHLPSHVPPEVKKDAVSYLKVIHAFVTYAEQEVSVSGAIWWPDIVGVRVIQCNKDCQFFSGPVFLQDSLIGEDNDSFSALFELLSGKSQGESPINKPDLIAKSYKTAPFHKTPPFAFLTAGLATSGVNSLSPFATSAPGMHLSSTKLTFGRQPVGTESTPQNVKLTNLGRESLVISSTKLKAPSDFSFIKPKRHVVMAGDSQTISVSFKPRQPFELNKRLPGRSENATPDLDERTATLEIRTAPFAVVAKDKAIDPNTVLHTVTLTGTAAPAPGTELWSVEPKTILTSSAQGGGTLTFGEQGVGTISAAKILMLVHNGALILKPDPADRLLIVVVPDGDFKVAGDYKDPNPHRRHETYTLLVTFEPKQAGPCKGTLTIKHQGPSSPLVVELAGTGAQGRKHLNLPVTTLKFDMQGIGTSSDPQYGELKNDGNAPFTVGNIEVIPDPDGGEGEGDFRWETTNPEQTVYAGQRREISVIFTPSGAGLRKAALSISSDAPGNPHKVSLTGMGMTAALSPNSLTFASRKPGNRSAEKDVTFTNQGPARLSITGIQCIGDDFLRTTTEETPPLPYSVERNQRCKISVAFEPKKAGKCEGTLNVAYTSGGRAPRTVNLKVSLTGTGVEE